MTMKTSKVEHQNHRSNSWLVYQFLVLKFAVTLATSRVDDPRGANFYLFVYFEAIRFPMVAPSLLTDVARTYPKERCSH